MSKITELIDNEGQFSYSYELMPPIKEYELQNLDMEPSFFSVTWHEQVHKCKDLDIAPIKLAKYLRAEDKNVLMHISCSNLKKAYLNNLLDILKDIGVCNLLIVLGDNFHSHTTDFLRTQDLILYIRERTGNYFCIGAPGYPDNEESISELKDKLNCGVDFIMTQAFFEYSAFNLFVKNCNEAGIYVPIVPGIFPFDTEKELNRFTKLCRVYLTEDLINNVRSKSGQDITTNLIRDIISRQGIKHFHFFTLNKLQRTSNLIKKI